MTPLLGGAYISSAGWLLAANNTFIARILLFCAAALFPVRGIAYIVLSIKSRHRVRTISIALTVCELAAVFCILWLPSISYTAFAVFSLSYLLLTFIVKGMDAYIFAKNRSFAQLIPSCLISVSALAIMLAIVFMDGKLRMSALIISTGFILTAIGLVHICDILALTVRSKSFNRTLLKIRMALPDITALFLPLRIVTSVTTSGSEQSPDAEVIFQLSETGKLMAGHCELCYKEKTYTFGNYDPSGRWFMKLAGDGIVLNARREEYIDWEINENKRIVISYGISLDEAQKTSLDAKIAELKSNMQPWVYDGEPRVGDIASTLRGKPWAYFMRATDGKYKTYFAPTINCVAMTNELLSSTGVFTALLPGIKTPGAYMELLERMYRAGMPHIISRRVYRL